MKVVLLGATGAVGNQCLQALVANGCEVVAVVRKANPALSGAAGVQVHVADFAKLEAETAEVAQGCDAAVSCLGIGQPSKVSEAEFRAADIGLNVAFAKGCASAGIRHFSLLSSIGAGKGAAGRYLKVKTEVEQAVQLPAFSRISIFRPSLLVTPDVRYGWTDGLAQSLLPALSPITPSRFRPIAIADLGRAIAANLSTSGSGVEVLMHKDFLRLMGR